MTEAERALSKSENPMSEKEKSNSDEYYYSDYQEDNVEIESKKEKQTAFSSLKTLISSNLKIVVIIIIAILLLIYFNFFHKGSVKKNPEPLLPAKSQVVAETPVKNSNTKDLLDNFQKNYSFDSQVLDNILKDQRNIKQSLEQLARAQQMIDKKIDSLYAENKMLQNNLKELIGLAQTTKNALVKNQLKNTPQSISLKLFYVQAMVPGRAWIIGEFGKLMTVKVGDKLPSYGIVQSIDVENNIIRTSSGRNIVSQE